jgi:hypothetical protein
MEVVLTITLEVGQQDTTNDAIESAQNQLRAIPFEDVLAIGEYEVLDP